MRTRGRKSRVSSSLVDIKARATVAAICARDYRCEGWSTKALNEWRREACSGGEPSLSTLSIWLPPLRCPRWNDPDL